MWLQMLIISVSLSIDAFGIGLSFELKGVKINGLSRFIMGLMSTIIMYISLFLGKACMVFFPDVIMRIIGISVLCLIGITFIKNSLFGEETGRYDRNQSKNIEWTEAVVLGAALSADAFSAGFALSVLDLTGKLVPVTVGLMQFCFLSLGAFMAGKSRVIQKMDSKLCGVLSGCLLILIALLKGIYG